ncbi:MAG: YdiU family protein [Clostridiales bacterium]|jgi:uncharacterized protein YdiU (UPF0061 family)|nr:YdiU family protein [Clostridiales bacterium]
MNFQYSYLELPEIFYREWQPEESYKREPLIFNEDLARELGILGGLPQATRPFAQAYAGFQFGHFNMLGDGRAVMLGELIVPNLRRFDVQLKGAGRTPFARGADGNAALGPMLREYIVGEFMAAAGVPTTRALAITTTGKEVLRERPLIGAVLTRVATSHIRVGTFDFARAYASFDELKALADYTIWRHFCELLEESDGKYLQLLRRVAKSQAELIAGWMGLGFVHGVMNTDNMAISGETLDYGPCAFLDGYNPAAVFSFIDKQGRYSYKNQPAIAAWNLSRLAEALLPLIAPEREIAIELVTKEIDLFPEYYMNNWLKVMRRKMGLKGEREDDHDLAQELLDAMAEYSLDFTETFRSFEFPELREWRRKWIRRLNSAGQNAEQATELLRRNNPAIIPRNHKVEQALTAAETGDLQPVHDLVNALRRPYIESAQYSKPKVVEKYVTFCGT